MRRVDRLFALAEYLRGRRTGTTAEAIADRFGITVRTVHRDLAALRDAHLPVRGERGRGGGLALDRAYTLPPINFTPREAAVLIAGTTFLADMRMLPFVETQASATDKLRGALSASAQRELLDHLRALQFIGVPQHEVKASVRQAIEQAWFEQQPLNVIYVDRQHHQTERRVQLQRLVIDRSETRLEVLDLDKNEKRELVLSRVLKAWL